MFNPTRRSRKIGKTQGGRVSDGKAREKWSRTFTHDLWQRLSQRKEPGYIVHRENPSRKFFHPVNETEIREVIGRLPPDLSRKLKAVLLSRQHETDLTEDVIEAQRTWYCVILFAFPRSMEMIWPKSPAPAWGIRHYRPWCSNWSERDGYAILTWTIPEIKRYYLYHLLLHEIGHINQPSFHARRRREAFAENFALEWARRWEIIP